MVATPETAQTQAVPPPDDISGLYAHFIGGQRVQPSGTPDLVRNTDILGELKKLSDGVDFGWISSASDRLAEVERGMRRNLLRSLSLDAFATALER